MKRYEAWVYSRSFTAGRLLLHRTFREWDEPRIDDWQLGYTCSGQGLIHCGEEQLMTRTGELLLFRPNKPRKYEPTGKPVHWEHIWAHFQPNDTLRPILGQLTRSSGLAVLHLPTPELQQKVMENLSEMCQVGAGRAVYREQLAYKLLETALIRCMSVVRPHEGGIADPRISRALDLLSENLSASFDSKALAHACGLSERQLFRLFEAHVHQSPRSYFENCRIDRARYLLTATKMQIAEVAAQVGFENPFYFATRFKSVTGLSPRQYRHQ